MELAAVIEALRVLKTVPRRAGLQALNDATITVRSDSQYVIRAFNDAWLDRWQQNGWRTANGKPVLNQDLWTDLLAETTELNVQWEWVWVWVRGHSGDPRNEQCDQLAVQQAEIAPNVGTYWVSAGNPRSHTPEFHHATQNSPPDYGLYEFDPECRPAPNLQAGDEVMLHGQFDQYEVFSLWYHEFIGIQRMLD